MPMIQLKNLHQALLAVLIFVIPILDSSGQCFDLLTSFRMLFKLIRLFLLEKMIFFKNLSKISRFIQCYLAQ